MTAVASEFILDEIDASTLRFLRSQRPRGTLRRTGSSLRWPAGPLALPGRRLSAPSRRQRLSAGRWTRHASRAPVRGHWYGVCHTTNARRPRAVSPRKSERNCSIRTGPGQPRQGRRSGFDQPRIGSDESVCQARISTRSPTPISPTPAWLKLRPKTTPRGVRR
jgi:hypothetical protein